MLNSTIENAIESPIMFSTMLNSTIEKYVGCADQLWNSFYLIQKPSTLGQLAKLVQDKDVHYKSNPKSRAKKIAKYIPSNLKITNYLDIGCNDGQVTAILGRKHLKLPKEGCHGVDVEYFDDQIQTNNEITFQTYDGQTLPYSNGQFELVSSIYVLHHVSLHQLNNLVENLYRVIKPGGFFLLREHDCCNVLDAATIDLVHFIYIVQKVPRDRIKQRKEEYQATYRSRGSWQELLERYGFQKKYGSKISRRPTRDYIDVFMKPI